jgi:hypothetical protein
MVDGHRRELWELQKNQEKGFSQQETKLIGIIISICKNRTEYWGHLINHLGRRAIPVQLTD